MANGLWCPHCGSAGRLVKNGTYQNVAMGIRVPRWRCNDCGRNTTKPLEEDPSHSPLKDFERPIPTSARYVITAAQNATIPHRKFLDALLQFCNHNSATLVIVPLRYRNPTSIWSSADRKRDWWHEDLHPYIYSSRSQINDNLVVLGDIRTQLTAEKPLLGFETITGHRSGILAHPKLQLRTIATPAHRMAKIISTTGAVTLADNYTDTKAGKKGQFHHTYGAAVVEVQGDRFFLRQINALRNGSFIDLNKKYTATGVEDAPPAAALVMGDTHVQFVDPDVVRATFGKGGIVETLKPRTLVWHDVLDFYSQSHWHRADPFVRFAKHRAKMDSVPAELDLTCGFIRDHTPEGTRSILIPSNHNEGLERWIREHDWKSDPSHMEFYLETALEMVRSTKMTENGSWTEDPFYYWARKKIDGDVEMVRRDQSVAIRGIECGFHGDRGPNGSKGSLDGFRRIGVKSIIGHTHSPGIEEGCYQTGTNSRLKLEYNTGPSGWLHTDCVIYDNGKRSLLNIIEGEWKI